jgi:glyoxylase-like metal-dependent hydrolase (beta-lactamase superfamily II)
MPPLLIPAGNASEWTGPTGNNTWFIDGREPALVDAGVGKPEHVDAVAAALGGRPLVRVLITHGHSDHVRGIPALEARWPALQVVRGAADGTVAAGDGWLRAIATPGHAPDHVCFFDEDSGDLYCGDMARLGGSIVIPAAQGGSLREYLASLERIRALSPKRLLPGHGPIVDDPAALIDEYIEHRRIRTRQVRAALAAGATTVDAIVAKIYPGISARLRPAAEDTVRAHMEDLNWREPN